MLICANMWFFICILVPVKTRTVFAVFFFIPVYKYPTRDKNKTYLHLFSIDELFEIFMSALNDLQQCSTKVQQIQVVMSMVKYAHGLR